MFWVTEFTNAEYS